MLPCQTPPQAHTSITDPVFSQRRPPAPVRPPRPTGTHCPPKGMALVQNSLSDSLFFSRDQTFFEMSSNQNNVPFQYYLDADLQQDIADMNQSTFDSYPGLNAFSQPEQAFYETPHLAVKGPQDTLKRSHQQRYTPMASPSLSASHSLDHAPSNRSHNSGTSGRSTASSAMGSPYSHNTHSLPGQEQWMNPPHGLGIAPGIVHNDFGNNNDAFTFPAEGDQLGFDSVKFPDSFVGEFPPVSSSLVVATSPVLSSPISYSSSTSQSLLSAVPSPNLALDPGPRAQPASIDTVLGDMTVPNNTMRNRMISPVDNRSPLVVPSTYRSRSPEQSGLAFVSPTTPASAMTHFTSRNTYPSGPRIPESRKRSIGSTDHSVPQGSPPLSKRSARSPVSPEAYNTQFQSPFFSQSSGRYVAPLQSSCWFPCVSSFYRSFFSLSLHSHSC